jgi:DinB family protein
VATTEWWQRGPVDGVPALLQPVAHILLQVRDSVDELTANLTEAEWNARPANVASCAFHVRHIAGVIDRLFTYARGEALTESQFAAIRREGDALPYADVPAVLEALHARVESAMAELRAVDTATLSDFRAVGRAKLPSTVIGCLTHGAEHSMRHVGQLSVTTRIVREHS